MIGGMLGSSLLPLAPAISASAGLLVLLVALFGHLSRHEQLSAICLQLAFVLLVAADHRSAQREATESVVAAANGREEAVQLAGRIDSEPIWNADRVSCAVRIDSMTRNGRWSAIPHRLMLLGSGPRWSGLRGALRPGDLISCAGMLQERARPRNPGEFDYGRYLELNDIAGIVRCGSSATPIRTAACAKSSLETVVWSAQRWLYGLFDSLHPEEHAAFLKGVVLGFRAQISDEVKQSFMETGTIHILAVSGSNVAVVALALTALLGFSRLPRRVRAAGTAAGILFYMLVTGSSPSVVRATIMALIVLGATMTERRTDVYNALGAAAVVLLLWNPLTLFDVGFQLSFAAVWSLVYFYPILAAVIRRIPERFEEIRIVDAGLKLFAVSLAAQIGTLPFTVYYFNRISVIAIVANLVVVPVSGLNVLIGIAEAMLAPVSMEAARCFAAVNDLLTWFLLGFVRTAADQPFASVETAGMDAPSIVLYYAVVVGILRMGDRTVWKKALIVALAAAAVLVWSPLLRRSAPTLEATFLDVGQGDAVVLRLPEGKIVLVDAGGLAGRSDAGVRTIVPFLRRNGIHSIDALVLTHAHDDHTGGARAVLRNTRVGTVIIPRSADMPTGFRRVLDDARADGVTVRSIGTGDSIPVDSSCRIYVVGPIRSADGRVTVNNTSVVLRVLFGKTSMLLPGDAEERSELAISDRYGPFLRSDILKAGHHGSKTSSSAAWIEAVQPRWGVVSVGRKNRFGHPSPATMGRMRNAGVAILRTDQAGAVLFRSDGREWKIVDWHGSGER